MTAIDISELSLGLHHNQSLALQKYVLLHEQHQYLRAHLDSLRSPLSPTHSIDYIPTSASSMQSTPYSSRSPSTSRSHSQSRRRSSMSSSLRPGSSRGSGVSLETVLDESTLQELAEEEAKLFDVNEGIKRALTELLNCSGVRADRALRTWVQCRLMEAEKELRVGRRRRSQGGYECA